MFLVQTNAESKCDQNCQRACYDTREQNCRNAVLDCLRLSFAEGKTYRYEVSTYLTVDSEQSRECISCRDSACSELCAEERTYDLSDYSSRSQNR